MPGTPVAKSASRYSANSFTCLGDMISFARVLRSSGRSAGRGIGERSPLMRSVGGRPTLRCKSEAFSCTICCRMPLKLKGARGGGACVPVSATMGGLAIRIDPEQDLTVFHRMCVLHTDLLDD